MDQRSDRPVGEDPRRCEVAGPLSAPLPWALSSVAPCRFSGDSKSSPGEVLSIEEVVRLTQVSRRRIALYYCRGLLGLVADPERDGWLFDREAIRTLFMLETMRRDFDLSLSEMSSTLLLRAQIESLRAALRQARQGLQTLLTSGPLKQGTG